MAPEKTVMSGRVNIGWLIRMPVMMTVMSSPPKRPTLYSCSSHNGKYKLTPTRGFESTVGKVAMIKPSDGEHTNEIENDSCYDCCPAPLNPENTEAGEMHCDERKDAKPIGSRLYCLIEVLCIHPGVEPTHESGLET